MNYPAATVSPTPLSRMRCPSRSLVNTAFETASCIPRRPGGGVLRACLFRALLLWQWQREMRQSSLQVGVTCGVPRNAAATSGKARIGRLNSCRDANAPLPPIPSAEPFSSSGLLSEGEYVDANNFATF
ncbi:unnamed protein product, partial [Taenia asiatica]|uniref:Uncharacterized protein n=1 Tax=Taenia asiatica TaxID=60517 RepID=A0A0R3VZ21_TAEAS